MYIREHRLAVCILNIVFNPRKHKFLKSQHLIILGTLKINKIFIFTTCTCFHLLYSAVHLCLGSIATDHVVYACLCNVEGVCVCVCGGDNEEALCLLIMTSWL